MTTLVEAYHNELLQRAANVFTGLATVLGAVSIIDPDSLRGIDGWVWPVGVLVVAVATLLASVPRGSQVYTYEQGGWSIELVRGDLLNTDGAVVITADRHASSRMATVGSTSLVGQLIERWYGNVDDDLTAEIRTWLSGHGVHVPVPLGTVVPFGRAQSKTAFMFCLAERTSTGSRTEWRDLSLAYARLWENLREKNLSSVSCPIIGAGFAGSTLSARGTLTFLLLGFHGVCLERRVTPRLRVVIAERDFDPRMYRSARAMLGELGYRR